MIFGINYCSMIRVIEGNKLRTYRKIKTDFIREQYLYADVDKKSLSITIHEEMKFILHIHMAQLTNPLFYW
jgi:hypothetical protein